MLNEALVAPLMFTPPFCHWNVGVGVPLAAAVKVTELPAVTVWLVGCVVKAGALLAAVTVRVAVLLVTADTELVAITV
jgi:hypothetical protein